MTIVSSPQAPVGWHYLSNATCLIRLPLMCLLRHYLSNMANQLFLLHYSPLLNKACGSPRACAGKHARCSGWGSDGENQAVERDLCNYRAIVQQWRDTINVINGFWHYSLNIISAFYNVINCCCIFGAKRATSANEQRGYLRCAGRPGAALIIIISSSIIIIIIITIIIMIIMSIVFIIMLWSSCWYHY